VPSWLLDVSTNFFFLSFKGNPHNQINITALGDFIFKLPQIITRKVLLNASPGLKVSVPVDSYLDRIRTPPYVSNIAEIHHRTLEGNDRYLILSSDGLIDLYRGSRLEMDGIVDFWAGVVGKAGKVDGQGTNKALELLRVSIGGKDDAKVSSYLTLEKDGRWIDDTTILVMNLRD
jgi:pyruvate dehydrogenase phosphatase